MKIQSKRHFNTIKIIIISLFASVVLYLSLKIYQSIVAYNEIKIKYDLKVKELEERRDSVKQLKHTLESLNRNYERNKNYYNKQLLIQNEKRDSVVNYNNKITNYYENIIKINSRDNTSDRVKRIKSELDSL